MNTLSKTPLNTYTPIQLLKNILRNNPNGDKEMINLLTNIINHKYPLEITRANFNNRDNDEWNLTGSHDEDSIMPFYDPTNKRDDLSYYWRFAITQKNGVEKSFF